MKSILHKIAKRIKMLIFIISKHFPRNKNLWVFGAWQGKLYADNSKYLFQYVNERDKNITCVWISKNKKVVAEIRNSGYKAYYSKSPLGCWKTLIAGVVFETEGNHDVIPFLIGGAKKIQLWHGMGIKDVKRWVVKTDKINKNDFEATAYMHLDDYWMVACEEAKDKYFNAYNVDKKRMFLTGQPKDDTFVNVSGNKFIDEIRADHPGCRILVYLPTHRNFGRAENKNVLDKTTLAEVDKKLAKNNIVMIFKPHFHEFKNYEGVTSEMSNIVFATDPAIFGDVYEFLPACDALLTDYSGIMFGYLTSGKPMIFFPFDLEDYESGDAGFCYNYEDVTPGPICYSWDEVVSQTAEIFRNDGYKEQRENLRKRFSPYNDGKNCERVYQQVLSLLKK